VSGSYLVMGDYCFALVMPNLKSWNRRAGLGDTCDHAVNGKTDEMVSFHGIASKPAKNQALGPNSSMPAPSAAAAR